ncbi:TauD/TfdA family dioxygenase [Reyranella sp. CPCC 100927]|uniref:TauD/TfdA dioxygenase family protein n=1 Tax=Reyranella sp. CPCC 100927 TaxID=2599616 RepID=UPI0011B69812|nr:TauD/TfdA family dioxygenase [Reyranella sp. CPCC 100927]TWT00684.1 TauD/TfdA family dioxygenase [Reyranella sp. CPCC 100927]
MASLDIRPLGYALGAQVTGVDLRRSLDSATRQAINDAWLQHLVLVFPDQDLSTAEQIAFSRNFGELDDHAFQPRYTHPDHREILLVTNKPIDGKPSDTRNTGRNWHTDLTFTQRPAKGALLLCREKPPVGGDTMWANMYLAYETLTPRMRQFIDDLEAIHDASLVKGLEQRDPEKVAELKRLNPPVVHPLVRVHPETGRQSLLVGQRIRGLIGLSDAESAAVLGFLNEHAQSPEFVYRHRWSVNDLVMWDNRCTQHIALPDFDQRQPRLMLRCSLKGEATGRVLETATSAISDREALMQSLAAVA